MSGLFRRALRSLISLAALAALLLLGFCPLRTCLTAWISHNRHVTPTKSTHLLVADNCYSKSPTESVAIQKHVLVPASGLPVVTMLLFGTGTFGRLNFSQMPTTERVLSRVPIYLWHQIWRI